MTMIYNSNITDNIQIFAEELIQLITASQSKEKTISQVVDRINQYYSDSNELNLQNEFNQFRFIFHDLLDQIIFEQTENYPTDQSVRESIFENLVNRLFVICESITNIESYSANLKQRKFLFEDAVIIKNFKLNFLIDYMITVFQDYPDLQKNIVKTLLTFNNPELNNFYYQITSGSYCYALRLLGLMGLKFTVNPLKHQLPFDTQNQVYNTSIELIIKTDIDELFKQNEKSFFEDLYLIHYIEINSAVFLSHNQLNILLSNIEQALQRHRSDQNYSDMVNSSSNTLLFLSSIQYEMILGDLNLMKLFLSIIEILPQEISIFINRRMMLFKSSFTSSISDLFSAGKITDTNPSVIKFMSLNI